MSAVESSGPQAPGAADASEDRPVTAAEFYAVHRLPGTGGLNSRMKCRMVGGEHICQWEPGQPTTTTDESDEPELDEDDEEGR